MLATDVLSENYFAPAASDADLVSALDTPSLPHPLKTRPLPLTSLLRPHARCAIHPRGVYTAVAPSNPARRLRRGPRTGTEQVQVVPDVPGVCRLALWVGMGEGGYASPFDPELGDRRYVTSVPSTRESTDSLGRKRWAVDDDQIAECRAYALEEVEGVRARGTFKVRVKEGKDH